MVGPSDFPPPAHGRRARRGHHLLPQIERPFRQLRGSPRVLELFFVLGMFKRPCLVKITYLEFASVQFEQGETVRAAGGAFGVASGENPLDLRV
jgi:hypothetical protein